MKHILLLILLFISLHSYAQSYKVSGTTYIDGVTLIKVEFDFGRWCVFMVDGRHDSEYVLSHGCVLRSASAYLVFDSDLRYVTRKDEERIKQSINNQNLCSK